MTKNKQRLGALSNSMIKFLYMDEDTRRKKYGYGVNSYYGRIVRSINQSFQDIVIAYTKLPKNQSDKIEVNVGLKAIHKTVEKYGDKEQLPFDMLDTTISNLADCLKIIEKSQNKKIRGIAEKDFGKVKEWLYAVQNYPKSKGPEIL